MGEGIDNFTLIIEAIVVKRNFSKEIENNKTT